MFNQSEKLGRLFFGLNYNLGLGNATQRMSEISFVSFERWPSGKRLPAQDPWRMTPEVIAEIVTPTCPEDFLNRKMAEYRWAGVKLIWLIFPEAKRMIVYQGKQIDILNENDILDGNPVFSGFRITLKTLFEDEL